MENTAAAAWKPSKNLKLTLDPDSVSSRTRSKYDVDLVSIDPNSQQWFAKSSPNQDRWTNVDYGRTRPKGTSNNF